MDIPANWTFRNTGVAAEFDRHVREQLPWYDLATGVVAHLARHYVSDGSTVYDIGASTGNVGLAIAESCQGRDFRLCAIEESQQMADVYRGPGELSVCDAVAFEYEEFDFAVLFLVLMFLRVDERGRLLSRLRSLLRPGGAIVVVDKVEPPAGYPGLVMHRLTLAGKVATGVPADEILAKELSLAGVQRPIAEDEIPQGAVEFFRFGEFRGWVLGR